MVRRDPIANFCRGHCDNIVAWLCLAAVSLLWPASATAATASAGAPEFTRIGEPVSIPADVSDHSIYVNVLINGRGPFRVLVDTGCSVTLVSPDVAEAVAALPADSDEDAVIATNGMGNVADVRPVILASVELGGVRFQGVQAAVSDAFDRMSAIAGKPIDGVLGYSLFADLFLGLDLPNHRVLLSSQWPAGVSTVRASLPLVEHLDVPFVQVQVQGSSIEAMIDTGANQALHLPAEIAATLQWKEAPRAGSLVAVIGEVGREQIGRLTGSLSLGNVQQIEPLAVVGPGGASLGLRSFDRYCVIFHPAEDRMWLCSADDTPLLPSPERTHGLSLYSEPAGWRIAGVVPGSPAESARLAEGALITQIEHRPAASWTRDEMQQWIDSHAGIALVVTDGSGERALTLPVWTIVP